MIFKNLFKRSGKFRKFRTSKQKYFLVVYYDQLIGYEKYLTLECPTIENDEIYVFNYVESNAGISSIENITAESLKFEIIKPFCKFPVRNLHKFKQIEI